MPPNSRDRSHTRGKTASRAVTSDSQVTRKNCATLKSGVSLRSLTSMKVCTQLPRMVCGREIGRKRQKPTLHGTYPQHPMHMKWPTHREAHNESDCGDRINSDHLRGSSLCVNENHAK